MVPTSFSAALAAAHQACSAQHYPRGALYVVATPIGNLADISLRALHVLQMVDAVACEDTRHTRQLLQAYGIERAAAQFLAAHQHNEAQAAQEVVRRLQQGQRVAFVSDAGTPGVSDPGARLVEAVRAAALPVVPLPGASSVTAALSVAGIAGDARFCFAGFLPTRAAQRHSALEELAHMHCAVVLLEAPHRIAALAGALGKVMPQRRVVVAREISKQFEEIAAMPAAALEIWLQESATRMRGEFVLVLHPLPAAQAQEGLLPAHRKTLRLLLAELPLKTAVRLCAEITAAPRNALYEAALQWRDDGEGRDDA